MEKIKNIEFLRIIGCISIILLHFANYSNPVFDIPFYEKIYSITRNGQKAVDLFFILSGFFFAYTLNLKYNCWEFIKHKLIRLYPLMIFVTLLFFIVSLTGIIDFTFYDNILSLLCLNGTGLALKLGNTELFWYISAMLWVLLLFYFLRKNYEKKNVNLFIICLVFFCYSFLIHAKGGVINNNVQTFNRVFNVGMLRGLGGIGLGYLIGEWYKANSEIIKKKVNFVQKLLYTGLEFVCLFFIINNLMLHKLHYKNHIIFIIVFAAVIILFLLRKGFISELLNNDICMHLSKYTYSFYMVHYFVIKSIIGYGKKYGFDFVYVHPVLYFVLILIAVTFSGVLTYHFVERPAAKYLKNAIK